MSTVHTFQLRHEPKPTLLCLHSSGSSGRQWQALATPLAASYRVQAPDLLGYADARPWPSGKPASLDDEAQALAPLLNVAPVHLFGHSFGAAVALQIALRWPERVRSLTLYEPVRFALLFGDVATEAAGESIVAVGRRIGLEVLSGAWPTAAARFVDYWSGDGSWQRLKADRQQAIAARMTKVQAEFEALFADRVPRAAYRRLTMPVRLIGGARSPLPARQVLDVLAAHLPDATRVSLAGVGHMGPVEAPQRVLEASGLVHIGVEEAQAA
jgi:pimeloyl-ACP methyl ester carboxylesterase